MKCAECDGKCLEGGTLCPECQQPLKGTNGSQRLTEVPGAKSLELDTNEPNPLSSGLSEDAPAAEQDPGPGLQPPADSAEAAAEERKVGPTEGATGEAETEEQKEGKIPDSSGSGSLEPEINEGNEENEGKPESPGLLKDDLFGQESGPGSQLQAKTEEHKDTSSDSNLAEAGRGDDLLQQEDDLWVLVPDSAEWRTSEPNQDEAGLLSSGRELGPGSQLQCHAAGVTDEFRGRQPLAPIGAGMVNRSHWELRGSVPVDTQGVWTQFDDICQFPEKSWFGFLSRGKSKEKASESILQFLENELYRELSHRKDFGDVERKLDCYQECLKTSIIGDAERKINDHQTDFDESKVYDYIRKFIENVLGNPKFQNPAISAMDVLLFALCTVFHHSIHISAKAMSKIEQMAQNVGLQEGKFMNLKEPRKRECILALKHVCIQSSKNSKSTCWVWLLPLLYEIQRESFEKAEDPLTSQDMRFLPFAQLRHDEEKQTKVLAMIKAHQTFIGSCAPLAEKVMEMLALKNFCREPVPHIYVPLQLLLSNVYQRITSRLAERREIDESASVDVNVALEDIARRTEAWLGTRRQTGNAEDALQPKDLEDVLQCLNLTFTLVTKLLKHPKKIPFNPVMTSLQIFELFSGTEDLLQTKRDFQDLKRTQGLKEFMNVAESWIKELFPKLSEQEKVFFDYIDKWQQLISTGLFCEEWTRDWHKLIKSLFAEWIKRVNHKHLFDHYLVFININKFRDTELENCFSQHIIQSIKGLTKSKKSMLKEILHKFSKTNKPILAQIISIIIENTWTEELNQIANANRFEENTAKVLKWLLNSSMGLDIISAVQKLKPKVQNQINRDAKLLLLKVSELFSFVGDSVFSGDIPFEMLPTILQHTQEFAEMLTLIEPSYSQYIKEVLDVRRNEFEQLKKQKEQRRAFLYLCSCIMGIINGTILFCSPTVHNNGISYTLTGWGV
ncbi:hypothetical protein UY3_15467 [Chelonia mydas]|uniref:Uncharacterized protein n=1 Tax=Chelonia mydas TaxID=8469 RepID=M7AQ86_CHEMY|nr:hypothetical protein UY3_15467 [Chelonia mydas]